MYHVKFNKKLKVILETETNVDSRLLAPKNF